MTADEWPEKFQRPFFGQAPSAGDHSLQRLSLTLKMTLGGVRAPVVNQI